MAEQLNWDYVILAALRDGEPNHPKTIYALIDDQLKGGISIHSCSNLMAQKGNVQTIPMSLGA